MTDVNILRERIRLARLAQGLTDEDVQANRQRRAKPDTEADFRYRRFHRHHRI